MKKILFLLFGVITVALGSLNAHAEEIAYPADWQSWTEMKTRLSSITALPNCEADVALFPQIYQQVVETYCVLRLNGPGKVDVLVKPSVVKSYETRDGKMPDGVNMILRFRGVKLLLVTAHTNGKPHYAVFNEDGKNVTPPSGPLAAETCENCHTGYRAYCVNGQCGKKR